MLRRATAVLFVACWLVLIGVELAEDLGFIQYANPDMDEEIEGALASLGEVIKTAGDPQIGALHPLSSPAHGIFSFYPAHPAPIYNILRSKETGFLKEDIPIHKLHRVFLI